MRLETERLTLRPLTIDDLDPLAEFYAEHSTRRRRWLPTWFLGLLARQSPHRLHTTLDTSGSRLHDREENLQAASDKIGGHPKEGRVAPQDLSATIFHCLGFSPDAEVHDTLGRPVPIVNGGRMVPGLV